MGDFVPQIPYRRGFSDMQLSQSIQSRKSVDRLLQDMDGGI